MTNSLIRSYWCGWLVFIDQHVTKATVPIAAYLFVLLEQLNRQQQIVKIQSVIRCQGFAVTPIDIGRQLAPLASAFASSWSGNQPWFGIADGPASFFGSNRLGSKVPGSQSPSPSSGRQPVVNRKLLSPSESCHVLKLVDVVTEHPQTVHGRYQSTALESPPVYVTAADAVRHEIGPGLAVEALSQA